MLMKSKSRTQQWRIDNPDKAAIENKRRNSLRQQLAKNRKQYDSELTKFEAEQLKISKAIHGKILSRMQKKAKSQLNLMANSHLTESELEELLNDS